MAKRIERSRIDSGKAELPRKLAFLGTEKIDYMAILDRDGELSVEVPATVLGRLAKARNELKTIKADQKKAATVATDALEAERQAHLDTRAALAKAERRVKSLEKKLAAAAQDSATPATPADVPIDASATKKPQASVKKAKATKGTKTTKTTRQNQAGTMESAEIAQSAAAPLGETQTQQADNPLAPSGDVMEPALTPAMPRETPSAGPAPSQTTKPTVKRARAARKIKEAPSAPASDGADEMERSEPHAIEADPAQVPNGTAAAGATLVEQPPSDESEPLTPDSVPGLAAAMPAEANNRAQQTA